MGALLKSAVDLENCASEPIRIPGSIQPHGALVGVVEPALEIVLASRNADDMLATGGAVRGRRLDEIVDANSMEELRAALAGDPRDVNPIGVRLRDGRRMHGLAHRSEGLLLIEFEPTGDDQLQFSSAYRRLVRRFDRLRRAPTIEDVVKLAADEVRELTRYDRVMAYRFDAHHNGEVVAEARSEDLEPFLGLHYPASDIPPQARQLYLENPVRIIADAGYEPVPIEPDVNPLTGAPVDLSHAALRSVSPIHCAYLQNMGVASSMSISITTGDRLWGLVACHHRTPHHVPYGTRLVAEFLAHVLSARVVELERIRSLSAKTRAYATQTRLVEQMVTAPRFDQGLSRGQYDLTNLLPCDGAAIVANGEVTRLGVTPSETEIRELVEAIAAPEGIQVRQTDRLSEVHPPAAAWADRAAGMIAVPISTEGDESLFWFRRERVEAVRWAGNPNEPVVEGPEPGRLSPRGSFAEWVEHTRGTCAPWEEWEVEVASDFRTALVASVIHQAAELERLNARLLDASQQKDRFLATVSHELRNPLNAIVGWVRVARMGLGEKEMERALETIARNADAQARLIDDLLDMSRAQSGRLQIASRPLDLAEVIRNAVESLAPLASSRGITIETEYCQERSDIIGDPVRLQQVVWNLLSNAVKFTDDGRRVWVALQRQRSALTVDVRDEGLGMDEATLPTIFEPFKQAEGPRKAAGLGLGLSIVKSIVELHGGTVAASSPGVGRGSTFTVTLPLAAFQLPMEAESVDAILGTSTSLAGVSILVVEDHPDAAEMIAALLRRSGAASTTVGDGREALERLRREPFDLLVSDLEMPHMDGFELIGALKQDADLQDLPTVALTAYGRGPDRARALQAGFGQHVTKPVDPEELVTVIASLLGRL